MTINSSATAKPASVFLLTSSTSTPGAISVSVSVPFFLSTWKTAYLSLFSQHHFIAGTTRINSPDQ